MRVRYKKHCVLQGFARVEMPHGEDGEMQKHYDFSRVVSVMRAADRHNRLFVGVEHVPTAMADNVLQDDWTEALQMI